MSDSKLKTVFELRDGRYLTQPDKSILYEACETLKEARKEAKEYGEDTFIVKTILKQIGERIYEEISSEVV